MTRLTRLQVSIGMAFVLAAAPALAADAVVYWNDITSQAVLAAPPPTRPGPSAVLDWAMVSAAMHDAVQAIEGKYEPYATSIPGASGSSSAAAAKAAHDILVHRFPDQLVFLDTTYHAYLAANFIAEDDAGVAVGTAAAAGLIAARTGDGSFPIRRCLRSSGEPIPATGVRRSSTFRGTASERRADGRGVSRLHETVRPDEPGLSFAPQQDLRV